MHAAEEDTADEYPQCNRYPAENCGLNRSVYRACAGDGGEVVSHKDRRFCGDIVHAVFHSVCRGLLTGIDSPFLCQPSAVEDVTNDEDGDADDK